MNVPERITVYEVGPRDGLQNVPGEIATDAKVAFVDALSVAGLRAIEVTSFVSPKWVPQLADGAEVMERIERRAGVRYPVLVPNARGLENALAASAEEVAIFTAASESFSRKNTNASIDETFERFAPVAEGAREHDLRLRGYVSTAFGCPFEGEIGVAAVVDVTARLFEIGCHEVSIGDTIGVADPAQVERVVGELVDRFDVDRLALHLHDTWGRGLANVLAGLHAGVTIFDASAGGLGGCPYAPGATGNLATEDLVAMLDRLGVETGVDLPLLVEASEALAAATGLKLPSRAVAAQRARTYRVAKSLSGRGS